MALPRARRQPRDGVPASAAPLQLCWSPERHRGSCQPGAKGKVYNRRKKEVLVSATLDRIIIDHRMIKTESFNAHLALNVQ